jgi:hypothetical protein
MTERSKLAGVCSMLSRVRQPLLKPAVAITPSCESSSCQVLPAVTLPE